MPKPSSVEALLARLAALRAGASSASPPGAAEDVARGLASRVSYVVTKAADLAVELRLLALTPQLVEAFGRLESDPKSPDVGCEARKAIAKALLELNPAGPDVVEKVFLPGLRVSHIETHWDGSQEDVGAPVRGFCAMGLAAAGYRDALVVLADLLADRFAPARVGAARALGHTGQDGAALLLRLKLTLTDGDCDPDAASECMGALVKLWPVKSLPFVASFLRHKDPGTRDAAALALGASRQPAAFGLLRDQLEREADADARRVLAVAIATLRLPQAIDYLISMAGSADEASAVEAIEALEIFRRDDAVRAKLAALVAGRGEQVSKAWQRVFGASGRTERGAER